MFSAEALRELFRHMEWADATVWAAALKTPTASGDTTLRNKLLHLHGVQQAFLRAWTNRPPDFPGAKRFSDLPAVRRWASPYYAEALAFLDSVDAAHLAEPLQAPWVTGAWQDMLGPDLGAPTVAETAAQVASHSMYHRGQINTKLQELGGEPPLVDYIVWVLLGRPSAVWESAP